MTKLTLPVLSLLIATPFMIAIGQVLFKMTSQRLVDNQGKFYTVLFDPVMILALAIYGSATLLWIYVLKTVPLSYAYSFMAMTFVLVPILAAIWLGDTITLRYAGGAACIIAGLLIIHS